MYQFRVTEARKKIESAAKRFSNKKGSEKKKSSSIYQRLLHELTVYNKNLPETQQLSLQDRYKLLSESIYPKYKGTRMYQFRVGEARKRIESAVKQFISKRGGDVIGIPPDTYQNILFWEVDNYLNKDKQGILSDGYNVKVNAGEYGETDIFNTADYNYYNLGVDEITNNINDAVRSEPNRKDVDKYLFYTGIVQLMPGRPNDGNAANYYLELVLVDNGIMATDLEEIEVPKRTGKRAKKKEKKTKKLVKEKEQKVQLEKSRVKRIRNSVEKEIQDTALVLSKKSFLKIYHAQFITDTKERELKRMERYFKNGTLNQTQYESLVAKINKAYK
jgi:hypothetical protein